MELAVTIFLVGVLLLAVLTAQSIRTQGHVRALLTESEAIRASWQMYRARYGALPGDDPKVAERWAGVGPGNGDGIVQGAFDQPVGLSGSSPTESQLATWHLRRAGFLTGPTDAIAPLLHPGTARASGFQHNPFGILGAAHCVSGVSAAVAEALDRRLDDGLPNAGGVQAGPAISSVATRFDDSGQYIVCVAMEGQGSIKLLAEASANPAGATNGGSGSGNGNPAGDGSASGSGNGNGNGSGNGNGGASETGNGNGYAYGQARRD